MRKPFHNYYLTQLLEQQKFKSTYLAYPQGDMKLKVVVKIFDKECMLPNQDYAKSLTETKAFLSLEHPHIVPVLNMDVEDKQPYVVTQYMPHGSLRQRLNNWSQTFMHWTKAVDIVIQIAQALAYAHERQIIHNNIKPDNIFFNLAGEVLLADFRPSHFIDMSKLDYKTDLHITSYMAPEQFMGKSTPASDQYSLACLAYELLAGHGPFFGAQNFSSMWHKHTTEQPLALTVLLPTLPSGIEFAILKAMAKKPAERYPDMAAFAHALESELPASNSIKNTPWPEVQIDFSALTHTSPYLYAVKTPEFSDSQLIPVLVPEEGPVSKEQTALVLKQNTYPGKTSTDLLAISPSSLRSSPGWHSQKLDTIPHTQNEQAIQVNAPSLPKIQRSMRSKVFVPGEFVLIIAVLFFLASCVLYALAINMNQNSLKYSTVNNTARAAHTTQAIAKVSATTIPQATVQVPTIPTTQQPQQDQQPEQPISIGSIGGSTNTQPTPIPTNAVAPTPTPIPTPTPTGCTSSFTVGVENSGSTTALVWFKPCNWTAGYVVLHYIVPALVQQNVMMSYNGNTAYWQFSIGNLSKGASMTYWFDYQEAGIQYPTGQYAWNHP